MASFNPTDLLLIFFPEVVPEPHPLLLVVEDPLRVHADLQAPVVATLLAAPTVAQVGVTAPTIWSRKNRFRLDCFKALENILQLS